MFQRDFLEKQNVKFVDPTTEGLMTDEQIAAQKARQESHKDLLCVPRRPYWDLYTKTEELLANEKREFLEWRRRLAEIQDDSQIVITPFEKNLEFWRQLWRVVERSDVITQIVDARNPLMFYCEDLNTYASEVSPNKVSLLLLNKSDFLTDKQRAEWASYFDSVGIRAVFFSALEESPNNSTEAECDDEMSEHVEKLTFDGTEIKNSSKLLTSAELISYFKSINVKLPIGRKQLVVGLVGYPNVGKSSSINAILKDKKVSVSATPGKTKHFQTLHVDDDLMLCDCPGLVFPNFVTNKAEMIVNGILPIDQMTDHVPAVNIVASVIPRHIFESTYGIVLPKPDDDESPLKSDELLNSFGYMRGFMTQRGLPDNPRSSRYILKDFVVGKLLYCYAPPGIDQSTFHSFPEASGDSKEMTRQQKRMMDPKAVSGVDFDSEYFRKQAIVAHSKGVHGVAAYARRSSDLQHLAGKTESDVPGSSLPPKSWKKHNNRNKKEKLRRVYGYLDE